MAEKCTCGHEKKDHFNGDSVCLRSCECLAFKERDNAPKLHWHEDVWHSTGETDG